MPYGSIGNFELIDTLIYDLGVEPVKKMSLSAFVLVCLIWLVAYASSAEAARRVSPQCSYKGVYLSGKVQIVDRFADLKVKVVEHLPDFKVQKVVAFPKLCGQWQIVSQFPDFKVEIVDQFEDIKIQYVDHFPGAL